jgi:hypothetical protein
MHELEAVGARGAGEAIEVGDVGRAGKVVRGGVEGARKSNIVKASTPAILAAIKALSLPYLNVPGSSGLRPSISIAFLQSCLGSACSNVSVLSYRPSCRTR